MQFKNNLSGTSTTTIKFINGKKEYGYGSFDVEWTFYIEARDFGIKEIGVYITSVAEYESLEAKTTELKEEDGWKYEKDIQISSCFNESFPIIPQDIIVDYTSKVVTIQF